MDALSAPTEPIETRPAGRPDAEAAAQAFLEACGFSDESLQRLGGTDGARLTALESLGRFRREGRLDEARYQRFFAEAWGLPLRTAVEPADAEATFVERIPIAFARRFHLLGLRGADGGVTLVLDDPLEVRAALHAAALLEVAPLIELAPREAIDAAIHAAYAQAESDFTPLLNSNPDVFVENDESAADEADLLDNARRAPVIQLVNMILFEAVKRRASDVHIQPAPNCTQVRMRIDGVLYDYLQTPAAMMEEIIGRIKVIGKMDIAEKRIPQDGRTTVTVGERSIDLRISVIPTSLGERAVLRLLDKSIRLYELAELGMSPRDRSAFESLLDRTHGIILVTGPTGSGKSTTLYAALQHLDCKEKNILTLEDPIEYELGGISQMQVSSKKGMSFATGLRAVLRQDPDIIMVGEIRDEETARMAVQSSLTGHLVFSTLHTNDAAGAVSRLLDLGIEPYLAASGLLASLAQRLVRLVCPHCRESVRLCADEIRRLQMEPALEGREVYRARGCEACAGTGYLGRQGIFELLVVSEPIRGLIVNRAKSSEIRQQSVREGMTTLRQDAVRKLLAGETTVAEMTRVTYQDEELEAPFLSPALPLEDRAV